VVEGLRDLGPRAQGPEPRALPGEPLLCGVLCALHAYSMCLYPLCGDDTAFYVRAEVVLLVARCFFTSALSTDGQPLRFPM
jgi:hypothetical protein